MRLFLFIILFILALKLAMATTGTSVTGNATSIKGGQATFGFKFPKEIVVVSTSTMGQSMGMLSAITLME